MRRKVYRKLSTDAGHDQRRPLPLFLDAVLRRARRRRGAGDARLGGAGHGGGARRSLGRGARSPSRLARGVDREHPGRRARRSPRPSRRHPGRFVGFFMVDPTQPDAAGRRGRRSIATACAAICLFPAMHRFPIQDERARAMFELAASKPGTAVFVHCGVLSVGVRKKLGLPSPFDIRFGNPLDLHAVALAPSAGADHHPALRRRPLSRGADGRRPLPERAVRHVELEQLDQVPARPDARRRLPPGARGRRPGPAAVRLRLVVLSAGVGEGRLRAAVRRAGGDRRQRGGAGQDLRWELRSSVFP